MDPYWAVSNVCVLHYSAGLNLCVHVRVGRHVCFASDCALSAAAEVECALTVDRTCMCRHMHLCVCVCVSDRCVLVVLMHAVAEHWGVALLSVTWKHVRELSVLLDTAWTWGNKKRRDWHREREREIFMFWTDIAPTWWSVFWSDFKTFGIFTAEFLFEGSLYLFWEKCVCDPEKQAVCGGMDMQNKWRL